MDGNSLLFRAFFALPPLTNQQGIHTNAVYGFTMMLLKILEEEQPTHMLVAFDEGKLTFRHETYAEYKGQREKTPGELSEQIPLMQEVLDAFGIQHIGVPNYEADDIIGTMSRAAEEAEMETLIVSGDKDLLQLVSPKTHVMLTRKGVTETERYDEAKVAERYGLKPQQIIDLKGLMGDASDHIPGIPGVGEKTALKLLKQFPSVEEVLAHVDELPGKKLREKVATHREQAEMSKQLATIYREVPLEKKIEDLQLSEPDYQQIRELFRRLDFKSLWEKVSVQLSLEERAPEREISSVIVGEDDRERWEKWLDQEGLALYLELDQENPHRADLVGFALSDGKQQLYIEESIARDWSAFRQWLAADEKQKILYDQKQGMIALARHGYELQGVKQDLLLAVYLLDPSEVNQRLSDAVSKYLPSEHLPHDDEAYGKGAKRVQLSGEQLANHLARKTYFMVQLSTKVHEEIQEKEMEDLYQLEQKLASILAKMELNGVRIDQQRLEELGKELQATTQQLHDEIVGLAGVEFNINSPKQLGTILFDKLGLPVLKKTKTGYSTSADVLEKLAPQHEIVQKILHYRQVGKLDSTYIKGLRKEIAADGKIHTQFHQTITATGRLSSSDPNLQNIPIRMEEGRRIRQVFIPEEGNFILSADYSQVELRVLAHLSQDPALLRAFRENRDIHTQTAMDIFSVSEEEVTSLMRRHAKAVNFGIVYGISDYGLAQNLNIPRKEAQEIIDRYFETYQQVKLFMDETIKQAKEQGYVTTLLGRRRYLPDIRSRNYNLRSFAERTAMNTPIQGTAADLIKMAMVRVDERMQSEQRTSRMLLQVHDELIFEVPEEEMEGMKILVREEMENALPELSLRLQVDIHVGHNWYEAK
jgi:DNA polymerase-1